MKMAIALVLTLSLVCFAGWAVSFKKQELSISGHTLIVEIAETEEQTQRGLMYRTELKDGVGMLFVFDSESVRTFWMKNTFVPLSIAFINSKKEIVDIQDMTPVKSEMDQNPPVYRSAAPARYALEVPRGWFSKKKIKIGHKVFGLN